jgi:hypothetical protein
MKQPKIIIAAPHYSTMYGGIIVLHKLSHILNQIGFDSYMIDFLGSGADIRLNPNFNTKNIHLNDIDFLNDIIVYPEITKGNPYNFSKCVRYILYYNNKRNVSHTWNPSDFWIYYRDEFYDSINEYNILTVTDTKVDFYTDLGLDRTVDSCFLIKKGNDYTHVSKNYHPPTSIEINNHTDSYFLEVFNRCKRFYSYDYNTYINEIAALCGCESVIVPLVDITIDQFRERNPDRLYGIAYGIEDIHNCSSTDILRNQLAIKEQTQYNIVKNMFFKIITYFHV